MLQGTECDGPLFLALRFFGMLHRCLNVGLEERMAETGVRREFRMELHGKEEGMVGELHHFREMFARGLGGDHHALFLELSNVGVVHFVAVTMAFCNDVAVDLVAVFQGSGEMFFPKPEAK